MTQVNPFTKLIWLDHQNPCTQNSIYKHGQNILRLRLLMTEKRLPDFFLTWEKPQTSFKSRDDSSQETDPRVMSCLCLMAFRSLHKRQTNNELCLQIYLWERRPKRTSWLLSLWEVIHSEENERWNWKRHQQQSLDQTTHSILAKPTQQRVVELQLQF